MFPAVVQSENTQEVYWVFFFNLLFFHRSITLTTERAAVKARSQQSSYLVSLSGVCEQKINIFSTLVHAEMIFIFFHLPSYRQSNFNINQKFMFVEIRFVGFFSLCTSVLVLCGLQQPPKNFKPKELYLGCPTCAAN